MKGSIGCPTHIVTRVPHQRYLCKHDQKDLSKEAKHRLEIIDWHRNVSPRYCPRGKPDASLTCRHFGITRSYLYRWLKRFNPYDLSSLENKSTAPKHKRQAQYTQRDVERIRAIRKANPTYSAQKIYTILAREYPDEKIPSPATIGRIIRRYDMFYRADVSRHRKKHKIGMKAAQRKRKPYDLKANKPHSVIEFDMKHIYLFSCKLYALCAIDTVTREAVIHISRSPTSHAARTALQKVVAYFGKDITIVCDNGSENMKLAEQYLTEQGITQYWCKPHKPKEKGKIERFIGTFQQECLDYHYEPLNVHEMQAIADKFLDKYHYYRPHQALGMLTPATYCATLGISIRLRKAKVLRFAKSHVDCPIGSD